MSVENVGNFPYEVVPERILVQRVLQVGVPSGFYLNVVMTGEINQTETLRV